MSIISFSGPQSSILLKASTTSNGRFVVLVPADLDYGAAIQRICELTSATGRCIQFLSCCKDEVKELSLRRQLVIMSALIGNGRVCAEVKVEIGMGWVDAVKKNYQTGDLIVCFAEQRAGLLQKPLNQILDENLSLPILILSGLYPQSSVRLNLLSGIGLWTGLLAIIIGCFILQVRITSLSRDVEQTILLILSALAEFWLIWFWNNLFG